MRLINIKLTRGDAPYELTHDQIWRELCKVFTHDGIPTGPVRSGRQPVDVRRLVETL